MQQTPAARLGGPGLNSSLHCKRGRDTHRINLHLVLVYLAAAIQLYLQHLAWPPVAIPCEWGPSGLAVPHTADFRLRGHAGTYQDLPRPFPSYSTSALWPITNWPTTMPASALGDKDHTTVAAGLMGFSSKACQPCLLDRCRISWATGCACYCSIRISKAVISTWPSCGRCGRGADLSGDVSQSCGYLHA